MPLIIDQYMMHLMLDQENGWKYGVVTKSGEVDLNVKMPSDKKHAFWKEFAKDKKENERILRIIRGEDSATGGASIIAKYGPIIGGIAAAALLVYLSYKLYKTKYSPAAKACANKSGEEKAACMKQYRVNALRQQLVDLRQSVKACDKSKDPTKCKDKVNRYMTKVNSKLKKVTV